MEKIFRRLFYLMEEDIDKLTEFYDLLNQMNSDIKFTMETDDLQMPFLDVLVTKDNTSLNMDIYYKPTDTHQYLHFGSSHPHQTKTAIPYNLARRICTIVSNTNIRDIRLEELKLYLLNQKYPEQLVDNGIKKAKECDRNSMLQGRIKEYQARNLRRFNVVSPYRPELCQPIFDQFISEYLPKAERNWLDNGQKITQVHDPCIVICLHSSRAPEDVNLTLQKLFISDIQVLIVGIQPCEKTIKPSSLLKYNLKSRIKDIRVYDFTDIVFSDTTEKCYLSDINVDAVDDISRFCGQQTNTSTVMPDNSSRKYETTKKKDIAMVKDSYSSDSNAYVHEGESHARDIDNCSMFEEGNAEIATSQRENYELHCPKPNDNQLNNASSSLQQPMNQTTEKTNIKCSKDQKSITKMDSQVNGIV
ncbi:uncharacterized protein LOC134276720 [Saccostrea cucullata]|uniref:uncharacterized protein LOC134276720 n=1 Tax=Saccostrea cuccullata TaxID=36930 RepID=UPI002ED3347B